jgi:hypothetical protein
VANETTAIFDSTHKRDKSNIIYQKLIKNRHPHKFKSEFSNISNNLHSRYIMFIDICLHLHPDVHPTDGVLHGGAAEATHRPEVELMTDATLSAAVVDDLFGIQLVAPSSRFPNADVGILNGQQQNVVVAIIKPVPPHNVVEIPLDEVAQPPQVGVLSPAVRG